MILQGKDVNEKFRKRRSFKKRRSVNYRKSHRRSNRRRNTKKSNRRLNRRLNRKRSSATKKKSRKSRTKRKYLRKILKGGMDTPVEAQWGATGQFPLGTRITGDNTRGPHLRDAAVEAHQPIPSGAKLPLGTRITGDNTRGPHLRAASRAGDAAHFEVPIYIDPCRNEAREGWTCLECGDIQFTDGMNAIWRTSKNTWKPDGEADMCPLCKIQFSVRAARSPKSGKHHCRGCGHVVCGYCSQTKYSADLISNNGYRYTSNYRLCERCLNTARERKGRLEAEAEARRAEAEAQRVEAEAQRVEAQRRAEAQEEVPARRAESGVLVRERSPEPQTRRVTRRQPTLKEGIMKFKEIYIREPNILLQERWSTYLDWIKGKNCYGVRTARTFEEGDTVMYYYGQVVETLNTDKHGDRDGEYAIHIADIYYKDHKMTRKQEDFLRDYFAYPDPQQLDTQKWRDLDITHLGLFCNEPGKEEQPNLVLSPSTIPYVSGENLNVGDPIIFELVAYRHIAVGEECMWCYGKDYDRYYESYCGLSVEQKKHVADCTTRGGCEVCAAWPENLVAEARATG